LSALGVQRFLGRQRKRVIRKYRARPLPHTPGSFFTYVVLFSFLYMYLFFLIVIDCLLCLMYRLLMYYGKCYCYYYFPAENPPLATIVATYFFSFLVFSARSINPVPHSSQPLYKHHPFTSSSFSFFFPPPHFEVYVWSVELPFCVSLFPYAVSL